MEFIKVRSGTSQSLCISAKTKMRINGFLNKISQIFQIQGRKVTGFVLRAHCSKCPFQIFDFFKPICFRQISTVTDAVRQSGVFVLQKKNDRLNRSYVVVAKQIDTIRIVRQFNVMFSFVKCVEKSFNTLG